MSNTNRQAARASLALVEAVGFEPCTADLTPFWAVPVLCDCCGCVDMAWQGRTLPADGACLSQREHDEIRFDRSLRWELVDELELDSKYYDWKRRVWDEEEERDLAEEEARQKAELVESWLQAA